MNSGKRYKGSPDGLNGSTVHLEGTGHTASASVVRVGIESDSLVGVILRKRYWIFTAALLGGLAAIVLTWTNPVLFTSIAIVQVEDTGKLDKEPPLSLMYISPSVRVILQQATSTGMYNHLIKTFALYPHYGIDPADPYKLEKVQAMLDKRILVRMSDENTVSIEVSDPIAPFAAKMANAIAKELQAYSQREEELKLSTVKSIYSMLRAKNQERSSNQSSELLHILNSELPKLGDTQRSNDFQVQIATLISQMRSSEDEFRRNSEYFEVVQAVMGPMKQPKVHILRRAVRDINTSVLRSSTLSLALYVLTSVLLAIFSISLWHLHGRSAVLALTREEPGPAFRMMGNDQHGPARQESVRQ